MLTFAYIWTATRHGFASGQPYQTPATVAVPGADYHGNVVQSPTMSDVPLSPTWGNLGPVVSWGSTDDGGESPGTYSEDDDSPGHRIDEMGQLSATGDAVERSYYGVGDTGPRAGQVTPPGTRTDLQRGPLNDRDTRTFTERSPSLVSPPTRSYELPPTPEWFGRSPTGAGRDRNTDGPPRMNRDGQSSSYVNSTNSGRTRSSVGSGIDSSAVSRPSGSEHRERKYEKHAEATRTSQTVGHGTFSGGQAGRYGDEAGASVARLAGSGSSPPNSASPAPMPGSSSGPSSSTPRKERRTREGESVWRLNPFVFYVPRR